MSDSVKKSQKKKSFLFLFFLLTMTASAISSRQSASATSGPHAKPVRGVSGRTEASADYRRLALRKFFQKCGCPAAQWTDVFIREADRNELDWRLVASISMIESTGGKYYKNRNILGWRSALQAFESEATGIVYVSSRLHSSPLYRGKSLAQVLRTYNSERQNYPVLINTVMEQLATIKGDLELHGAQLALNNQAVPQQRKS